jgi:hypothetical protein
MSIDLSQVTEPQVKVEGDKITTYQVVKSEIDLAPLKEELACLEAMTPPTDKEVLSLAKKGITHPYYDPHTQDRIDYLRAEIAHWEQ